MSKDTSALLQKQEFLSKWIKGLQIYTNSNQEMTILERKKAIKLSADVAIASTRNASTRWSRALIAGSANRTLVEQVLGRRAENKTLMMIKCCSKKIVRRSRRRVSVQGTSVKACCIAKRLVKKRTLVLKRLVPGGEGMDEICLIKETLDYIASLRVQVDMMRRIAVAAEHSRRLL